LELISSAAHGRTKPINRDFRYILAQLACYATAAIDESRRHFERRKKRIKAAGRSFHDRALSIEASATE
jgi:hypothetical protein